MKRFAYYLGLVAALVVSCSVQEENIESPLQDDVVFYASFEQPAEGTKVYVNKDLYLRWTADDRVSIFNKITYNQQYKFLGETGDNAGGFNKVDAAEFVTGNPIPHVVSVYPYQEGTKISEDEVITLTLPAEQHYAENTFGLGANTMISVSEDNVLQYKNVCGYLRISLYGEGVSVSSITLKGNNGEKLAGKTTVTLLENGTPTVKMADDATTEIILDCKKSVVLGPSHENCTDFWFVLPPVSFVSGFTIIVKGEDGESFTKSTRNPVTITRNVLSKMSPFEVELDSTQPTNIIYYTSTDGEIVSPHNSKAFGVKLVSNDYADGVGIMVFEGDLTIIGNSAFSYCETLKTIELPSTVETIDSYAFQSCIALANVILPNHLTQIGQRAFSGCKELSSIILPEGLTLIGDSAFSGCSSLNTVTIPRSLTEISGYLFSGCTSLSSISLPDTITNIWDSAFRYCSNLTSINLPPGITEISNFTFSYCTSLTDIIIPDGVTRIGSDAFSNCTALTGNLTIPNTVTSIGTSAFMSCTGLTSVTVLPTTPPKLGNSAFSNFIGSILVPVDRVNAYKDAEGWSVYSNRIAGIGISYIYYTSTDGNIVNPKNETAFGNLRIVSNTYTEGMGVITIAGNLTTLSAMAFLEQTTLKSIIIPESVTNIGAYAFYNCTNLVRIDVCPLTPPIGGEKMFTNTGSCLIYIPLGCEDAYVNAEYWADYALRMRVEGDNSSLAYSSSDYSHDGEVLLLQQSTIGRGINLIFMGDGFLDKDMENGGKYEQRMREAMEQFFVYEPYKSLRNRFNVYTVKVVSQNSIYWDENSNRRLTYEKDNSIMYRTELSTEYGNMVPNPYHQPLKICTICNTKELVGRSFCSMNATGWASCIIYDPNGNVLNHEFGGHGFGLLWDEYEERTGTFTEKSRLDDEYTNYGWGGNVDWRSNPDEVRWARLLKDTRYSQEGLGVYEGAYLYSYGIYRSSDNSMMRHHDSPFNAPSREQIYKNIMKYSEGDAWVYDYEEFVKADESGRAEAAKAFEAQHLNRMSAISYRQEEFHCPPILIDETVKDVGVDNDGNVILIRASTR